MRGTAYAAGLLFGDTDDLAMDQMFEINIGIRRGNRRRADIQFVCNSVECIARHDGIAPCVFSAAVDRHIDIRPRLQAFWIHPRVYIYNAFNADTEVPCNSAYRVTSFDAV